MPTFRLVTASAKYGSRKIKLRVEMERHRPCAKKQQNLVPGARIELATPAFSGRRSTNELPRLFNNL
jgi:hypothetical protein